MSDLPSPLWCANDAPHGPHSARNEFGGTNECTGRPARPTSLSRQAIEAYATTQPMPLRDLMPDDHGLATIDALPPSATVADVADVLYRFDIARSYRPETQADIIEEIARAIVAARAAAPADPVAEFAAFLEQESENWRWDSVAHGMDQWRYVAGSILHSERMQTLIAAYGAQR